MSRTATNANGMMTTLATSAVTVETSSLTDVRRGKTMRKNMTKSFMTNTSGKIKTMATETPELKPCPFCGSVEMLSMREALFITCDGCIVHGPSGETREDAIARWNTRAEVKASNAVPVNRKAYTPGCAECGAISKYICGQCSAHVCEGCLIQDGKRTCVKCPVEENGAVSEA